jgi:DNA polymerase III gamma/tau subunit
VLTDLTALSQGNATTALDWAQGLAKATAETDTFILLTQLWYRDLLLLSYGAPERLVAHQDRLADLQSEAAQNQQEVWLARLAALNTAQRHLRANLNPELTLDLLGFRLQK